jgi:hypothetical protein
VRHNEADPGRGRRSSFIISSFIYQFKNASDNINGAFEFRQTPAQCPRRNFDQPFQFDETQPAMFANNVFDQIMLFLSEHLFAVLLIVGKISIVFKRNFQSAVNALIQNKIDFIAAAYKKSKRRVVIATNHLSRIAGF